MHQHAHRKYVKSIRKVHAWSRCYLLSPRGAARVKPGIGRIAFIAYLATSPHPTKTRVWRLTCMAASVRARLSPTSFFVHHTHERLSKAAACGNIDGILKVIQVANKAVSPLPRAIDRGAQTGAEERDRCLRGAPPLLGGCRSVRTPWDSSGDAEYTRSRSQ